VARLLHRLGMLAARKPLVVIGAWVVMLVIVFGAVAKIGSLSFEALKGSISGRPICAQRSSPTATNLKS